MAVNARDLIRFGEPTELDRAVFATLTAAAAAEVAGTLSKPSKMPSFGYSTPAARCQTGTKLRAVEGSTCAKCYAFERGNYRFSNVQAGLEKRFASLTDPRWVGAMARQIAEARRKYPLPTRVRQDGEWVTRDGRYFRWHDSGDLQGPWHLANICAVARLTPDVAHWLPTREYRMVRDYLRMGGTIPANLTVRLSAHMVDGATPSIENLPVSSVHTLEAPAGAHDCPAVHSQENQCGDCRACWTGAVRHVSYHAH